MSEGWIAVEVTLSPDVDAVRLDILSGELFELEVAGIELRDTQSPPSLIATFEPGTEPDAIREAIEGALEASGLAAARIEVRSVEPVDWATHWRASFTSLAFGPLWVVPTWLEPPVEALHVLRLDPGMAFGTGTHETTALCLERIVAAPPTTALLDVGTGTAILALGALRMGTPRAVGTDVDPDALVVARENAEANGLSERLELSGALPEALGERFDFVVANVLRDPLIRLAPSIAAACAPGAVVLLSGLLTTQVDAVVAAYAAEGMEPVETKTRGEWALVELAARS